MRKLKGITINGEWLGDNIIINANFRAICNFAPFVIQEFAKLINSIDNLDNAVTVNNYYFPDNNTINIEFSNNSFSGLAHLCFHLLNGLPETVSKNLTVYTKNSDTKNNDLKEIADENVKNIEAITVDEDIEVSKEIYPTQHDESEKNCDKTLTEPDLAENLTEMIENRADDCQKDKTTVNHDSSIDTENAISVMLEDLAAEAPALALVQIQIINTTQEPVKAQNIIQNEPVTQKESTKITAANKDDDIDDKNSIQTANVEIQKKEAELITSNSLRNITDKEPEDFSNKNSKEKFINKLQYNSNLEQKEQTDVIDNNNEFSDTNQNMITADNKAEIKELQKCEEEEEEEIQNCLADFYESTLIPTVEPIKLNCVDNIAMQAMLNEMSVLREELNRLKNEKVTYEDLFGQKEKMKNNIDDEDADFKIMGSEERVNASILDEELFVAGNRLYKWGDTLYLNE